MVRAFAHGALDLRISFMVWTTTGITKAVVCAILSVGCAYKRTLAVNWKE